MTKEYPLYGCNWLNCMAAYFLVPLAYSKKIKLEKNYSIFGSVGKEGMLGGIPGASDMVKAAVLANHDAMVMPSPNEKYLFDLIVLKQTNLLWKTQVLIAKDLDEAMSLLRVDKKADYVTALKLFNKIQSKLIENKSLLFDSGLKVELEKVLDLMPQHASAKTLITLINKKNSKRLSQYEFLEQIKKCGLGFYLLLWVDRYKVGRWRYTILQPRRKLLPKGLGETCLERLSKLRAIIDSKHKAYLSKYVTFVKKVDSHMKKFDKDGGEKMTPKKISKWGLIYEKFRYPVRKKFWDFQEQNYREDYLSFQGKFYSKKEKREILSGSLLPGMSWIDILMLFGEPKGYAPGSSRYKRKYDPLKDKFNSSHEIIWEKKNHGFYIKKINLR